MSSLAIFCKALPRSSPGAGLLGRRFLGGRRACRDAVAVAAGRPPAPRQPKIRRECRRWADRHGRPRRRSRSACSVMYAMTPLVQHLSPSSISSPGCRLKLPRHPARLSPYPRRRFRLRVQRLVAAAGSILPGSSRLDCREIEIREQSLQDAGDPIDSFALQHALDRVAAWPGASSISDSSDTEGLPATAAANTGRRFFGEIR